VLQDPGVEEVPLMSKLPCREEPDLFFAESPRLLEQAQMLCAGCPVQELCLAGALERREPHGVWGGKIVVAGEIVEHKRGRGRPRKTDVA
jgi:WhiB family redox-sensing transcriptional regulator